MSTYTIDTVRITLSDDSETYAIEFPAAGYKTNGYNLEGAVELAVKLAMTNEDVDEWHVGNLTTHMRDILNDVDGVISGAVVQVFGSTEGNEPLHVHLS